MGEEIARGGAGVVYRATNRAGQPVALKLLHSQSPVHLRRFLRETQALVRLGHPNVITIHDVGEARGAPYLVMDLIDGESLQDRIDRDGPLPAQEATPLILDVARALAHAHAVDVLHRDVKPANVLLPARGGAILTDFGLARDMRASRSSLSKTGTFLGTPGFWPPEQARGELEQVGPTSDVYSLGATLYATLTGQPPFTGDSLIEVLGSTCTEPPTPPSQLVPYVDRALERICLRCLEKDPARRYPSAEALVEALESARAGETARTGSALAIGLGVLVLVLVGVLGVILTRDASAPLPPEPQPASASPQPTEAAEPAEPDRAAPLAALITRATALDTANDWPALKAVCDQALRLDPDHVEALRLRARAQAHLGDPKAALADVDRALRHAPRRSVLHLNRGLCQLMLGRTGASLADFERAIRYDRSNVKALISRALALFRLQRYEEAIVDATTAIGLDESQAQAWILRGNARHKTGALEAAEADFTRAIKLEPKNVQALHNRGMARVGQGKFKLAIADYSRGLQAEPRTGYLHASRGMARERLQDDAGAVADYRKAIETLPPDSQAQNQVRDLLRRALKRLAAR